MIPAVPDGKPSVTGMYVAYVDDPHIKNYAAKMLLMYIAPEKKWYRLSSDQTFRGHVYLAYGPLPALKLEENFV